jgi:diguanylate cyclase (GGDEF)-like protein
MQNAKDQDACLIMIRGNPQGHRFFLNQKEILIGREPAAEICLNDQGISRRHAQIIMENEAIYFLDLGSSNGSFVNNRRLNANEKVRLAKEDMIKLGSTILKYLPKGELEILFYGALGSAAHTDSLTKIYNKGYLLEALEAEFKRARALHSDFSIIFFDLDHFKKVNDTYGHDAGDYVLKEMTHVVRTSHVRPKDIFARYGGEEFVLLLSNTSGKDAREIAERIRAGIETHPFIYEGKRIPVTTSLGVTELIAGMESAQTLLKKADQALYAAKSGGRNQVVFDG